LPTFDSTSHNNKIIGIGSSVASTLAIHRRLSEYHFNTWLGGGPPVPEVSFSL
jgi:hypothetical protein